MRRRYLNVQASVDISIDIDTSNNRVAVEDKKTQNATGTENSINNNAHSSIEVNLSLNRGLTLLESSSLLRVALVWLAAQDEISVEVDVHIDLGINLGETTNVDVSISIDLGLHVSVNGNKTWSARVLAAAQSDLNVGLHIGVDVNGALVVLDFITQDVSKDISNDIHEAIRFDVVELALAESWSIHLVTVVRFASNVNIDVSGDLDIGIDISLDRGKRQRVGGSNGSEEAQGGGKSAHCILLVR